MPIPRARAVRALAVVILACAPIAGPACDRAAPRRESAPNAPAGGPAASTLHLPSRGAPAASGSAIDAADFIAQQIALRIPTLRAPLVPVLPLVRGALSEGGSASHTFEMSAGHCYRVVAVGGVGADDLDLSLFAPDGSLIESDERRDEDPVLGSTRPLCPPNGGTYRVEVRMVRGHGEYGVQVLGTP